MTSREQFEAWWVEGNDGMQPRSGWEDLRTDDGYNDEFIDMQYEGFKAAEAIYQQQLSESRREFTAASAPIHNLELKVERVVAENDRAVKAVTVFSNVAHDITEIICDELGQERVVEIVAAYNDLGNMPNTDVYLAEVRAQAVDEIAELYFTLAAHEANRSIADSWRESARFARDHAAQLRQGGEHE